MHSSSSATSSKVTKKKTIMDRFRLKKSIRREAPTLHDRPLSDEISTQDTLAVLLNADPSRSLPATPLARKRAENIYFSPPESPVTDPETPLSPDSPANVVTVPVEVNSMRDETSDVTSPCSSSPSIGTKKDVEMDIKNFEEQHSMWDKIRKALESDEPVFAHDLSYDILPKQDQEWMNESTGMEQLRAFLTVCD